MIFNKMKEVWSKRFLQENRQRIKTKLDVDREKWKKVLDGKVGR